MQLKEFRKKYSYDNGYTVSVINTGYGKDAGLFEVAILDEIGEVAYDSPLLGKIGIRGWMRWGQVCDFLKEVKALPAKELNLQKTV
jgi:hypothetical protein